MFGTASFSKQSLISSLHATPIDYRSTDFREEIWKLSADGVDVVFDAVGRLNIQKSYQTLRKHGRLICYGFQNGKSKRIILSSLMRLMFLKCIPDGKKAKFYSISATNKTRPYTIKEDLSTLLQLLANGAIQPIIMKSFSLRDVRSAHEMLEQGNAIGKILITI
jgi:NADPH:quinone reductase-like Zn-dependent oxidoreductase